MTRVEGKRGNVKLMLTVVGVHVVENRRKSSRRACRSCHAIEIDVIVPLGDTLPGSLSTLQRRFLGLLRR